MMEMQSSIIMTTGKHKTINPAILWYGAKTLMIQKILSCFPPIGSYQCQIDCFGGGCTITLNSPKVPIKIYNDLERNVYTFHKIFQDDVLFLHFKTKAENSLYDEETCLEYRNLLKRDDLSDLDRAYYFWYVNRTTVDGIGGFSYSGIHIRKDSHYTLRKFRASIERLDEIHAILKDVITVNKDAVELIKKYDNEKVFLVLDPPYVKKTRKAKKVYKYEQDDTFHEELVRSLLELKSAKVLLCGYDNDIYGPLEANGWHKKSFEVGQSCAGGVAQKKIESIWTNYEINN